MPAWQIVGLGVGAPVLVIVGVTVGRMVPLPGRSTPTPTTDHGVGAGAFSGTQGTIEAR